MIKHHLRVCFLIALLAACSEEGESKSDASDSLADDAGSPRLDASGLTDTGTFVDVSVADVSSPGSSSACGVVEPSGGYRPIKFDQVDRVDSATVLVDASRGGRAIPIRVWFPHELPGRLPVIVFSHGGGANPDGFASYEEWARAFASAGFVSIHPSHLAGNKTAICTTYQLPPSECAAVSTLQVDRPLDAAFVVANLADIETALPILTGRLDKDRTAIAGHSFGAYTVTSAAGGKVNLSASVAAARGLSFATALPRAFLALSPQGIDRFGWGQDSWNPITRPYMSITGDCDDSAGEQAKDRLDPFIHTPAGDKYLAYVIGAQHRTIGGNGLDKAGFPHAELVPWIQMAGVAFMDAHLKNCANAKDWLRSAKLAQVSNGKATMFWKLSDNVSAAVQVSACADL